MEESTKLSKSQFTVFYNSLIKGYSEDFKNIIVGHDELVKNLFKNNEIIQIEDLENGWIKISLFSDEEQVYFEIANSLPLINFSKDEVGGIGLQNVKRQLELLYPNKHQLEISRTEKEFKVYLTVYL